MKRRNRHPEYQSQTALELDWGCVGARRGLCTGETLDVGTCEWGRLKQMFKFDRDKISSSCLIYVIISVPIDLTFSLNIVCPSRRSTFKFHSRPSTSSGSLMLYQTLRVVDRSKSTGLNSNCPDRNLQILYNCEFQHGKLIYISNN